MRTRVAPTILLLTLAAGLCVPYARADETKSAIKEFKKGLKAESWKDRAEAYTALAFYDGAAIVGPLIDAIAKETHGAVRVRGMTAVGRLQTPEAKDALLGIALKGKDLQRALALISMQWQVGDHGAAELIKLLGDKNGKVAGLAALALGKRQNAVAIEPLTQMLSHSDWQCRAAAARALNLMAGEKPKKKFDKNGNVVPEKNPKPWVPTFYDIKKVLPSLVQALSKGVGSERLALIECLERLTKQAYGWDLPAWKRLAAGTDPNQITSRPKHPPYLFGVPMFGQRIVVIYDRSMTTDDPHPFTDAARLKALCTIPGGRPIPWFKLKKRRHFMREHTKRWVNDMPKGVKFDIVLMGQDVDELFGKLTSASTGTKKKAVEALEEMKIINGSDSFTALHRALDLSGAKDYQAWKKGPDEILFISCGIPWLAKEMDQENIGADVGLKALLRLVPIHTVGIGGHPYAMMKEMSKRSGGRYMDLTK